MLLPSPNPLFIEHADLKNHYEYFEKDALWDADWLWQKLNIDDSFPESLQAEKLLWHRLNYHSLALFFTEIGLCYAYWRAVVACGINDSRSLLFYANNAVLRIGSCWDRMGFYLNDYFDLQYKEDKTYFGTIIAELCSDSRLTQNEKRRVRKLKELFDRDANSREWRNIYLHRYGEYHKIERSGGRRYQRVLLNTEDRKHLLQEIGEMLPKSFDCLKKAMKVCSSLTA